MNIKQELKELRRLILSMQKNIDSLCIKNLESHGSKFNIGDTVKYEVYDFQMPIKKTGKIIEKKIIKYGCCAFSDGISYNEFGYEYKIHDEIKQIYEWVMEQKIISLLS